MVIESPAVIIGGFGLENFGDDILMLASINAVSRVYDADQITVLVHVGGESYCRQLCPAVRYVARELNTEIQSEVVVYGGGTQFYQFAGTPVGRGVTDRARRFLMGLRQGRMGLQNLWRKSRVSVEISGGSEIAAISLGLGPFGSEQAQAQTRSLLNRCGFLAVRDRISLDYCQEWQLSRAVLRSDFGYAPSLWGGKDGLADSSATSRRIGIIVRDWYRTEEGFRHLAAAVKLGEALDEQGYEPVFFVFDGLADTTSIRMLKHQRWSLRVWSPKTLTIDDQLGELARCDLLVTARAHGAIVGATLGLPSVCVEIEPKLRIMAESLGDAASLWSPPFDVADGVEQIDSMCQRLDHCRQETLRVGREHGRSAEQSADELAEFLRPRRRQGKESS